MNLLLFQSATTTATSMLFEYGVLGIFAALMVATIVFLVRHFLAMQKRAEEKAEAAHKENEDRIKDLERKLYEYLQNDKKEIIQIAIDSKNAIENSNSLAAQLLKLIEYLKLGKAPEKTEA